MDLLKELKRISILIKQKEVGIILAEKSIINDEIQFKKFQKERREKQKRELERLKEYKKFRKGVAYQLGISLKELRVIEKKEGRKVCSSWKAGITKRKGYLSWLTRQHNKRKKEAEGTHTYGQWELLKKQYGYTCPCCKLQEPFENQNYKYLTEDHIIPLIRGGSDYIENIQPLCHSCNSRKHTKIKKY